MEGAEDGGCRAAHIYRAEEAYEDLVAHLPHTPVVAFQLRP